VHDLVPLSWDYQRDVAEWLEYSRADFEAIVEGFRNHEIWERDADGTWFIPGHLEG
jgi:hypothetical protein